MATIAEDVPFGRMLVAAPSKAAPNGSAVSEGTCIWCSTARAQPASAKGAEKLAICSKQMASVLAWAAEVVDLVAEDAVHIGELL
jgi:hypothetical protein